MAKRMVSVDGFQWLPKEELVEVNAKEDAACRLIGGCVDSVAKTLTLLRGEMSAVVAPFAIFFFYVGRWHLARLHPVAADRPRAGGCPGRLRSVRGCDSVRAGLGSWLRHPKVPMNDETRRRLSLLADQAGAEGRKVSPMQIAAQILEDALAGVAGPDAGT